MFAVIAAVLFLLAALGVTAEAVDLVLLAFAFWAAHFAWGYTPWGDRRGTPG